jgi:hypothetical protein
MLPVLFAESNSVYKSLGCDVYDLTRNAYSFSDNRPVIAHPPCRLWSRLRAFSTAPACEKLTAVFAVHVVRQNGGVLEHPVGSSLWSHMSLPLPGKYDKFGGFTVCINQSWFGHPCKKPTFLYWCGIDIMSLDAYPLNFNAVEYCISSSKNGPDSLKEVHRSWRNRTPIALASYLINNVKKIKK